MTDTSKFRPEVSKLFEPGPPLRLVEHIDYPPPQRKTPHIDGIAGFLAQLKAYKETQVRVVPATEPTEEETAQLEPLRLKKAKELQNKEKLDDDYNNWNPHEDPHIKGDPYRTLFIGRLDYEISEIELQQVFSKYGDIERVRVVRDKNTNKSKGYGFIVFERETSARDAYKAANGLKLKSREILTDIERGRTSKSWLPRRLGGGMGGRGYTERPKLQEAQHSFKPVERPGSSSGRGGGRFATRGRGGFDRGGGRFGSPRGGFSNRGRGGHDGYDSRRGGGGYSGRSERSSGSDARGGYVARDRPERADRADRAESKPLEYSSRSRREGSDFTDRQRDNERDSRVHSDRERERERYREKRIEQRERTRY